MGSRGRVFTDYDRQQFFAAPIGGLDYRTADAVLEAIDAAAEQLTGDRTAFHRKPHGGSVPIADATLKPVEDEDR